MYKSIGECVKATREKMGISQLQIAEYLGVDLSYITDCEENKRPFRVDILEKLANLFGCSYEYLEDARDIHPNMDLMELQDLNAIASINKIASNIREMKKLLQEKGLK